MYKLLRPLIFTQNPENAHDMIINLGELLANTGLKNLIKPFYNFEDQSLETTVFGINFPNPVGLAAGYDKEARLINFFDALGFGFIETGTVTPLPQVGNDKPRLFRLADDEAVINRMGFNNGGTEKMVEQLKKRKTKLIIGGNIGKNKVTANEEAVSDYEKCFKAISPYIDYLVVNVSSPNTPGLRELQDKAPLTALLKYLKKLNSESLKAIPLLLKIAPDLNEAQLDDIVAIMLETKIDGLIATNTTIGREGLGYTKEEIDAIGMGGLSGKPLTDFSTKVLKYVAKKSQGKFPIIGVGGIFSAEDAYEKIKAGASLIQVYTGLIYEGPALVKKIKQGLIQLLKEDGFKNIQEAVGVENK